MISFDISKKFNLKKINFNLSKEINLWADAVVLDHKKRLQFGQGVNENPMKKLTAGTVHSKRFKGFSKPRIPLYGTGAMSKVYVKKRASASKQKAIIIPPKKRQEVAKYHQFGTPGPYLIEPKPPKTRLGPIFTSRGGQYFPKSVMHPGLPKREWFGITKSQERVGFKLIESEINRQTRNA
tara:strand:+ start:2018 stop:2560 length:543 start_codon:yes stop_codon:yes gene_type:complete